MRHRDTEAQRFLMKYLRNNLVFLFSLRLCGSLLRQSHGIKFFMSDKDTNLDDNILNFVRPAKVCLCKSVSRQQIINSILRGNRTFEAISADTLASTGCGTCKTPSPENPRRDVKNVIRENKNKCATETQRHRENNYSFSFKKTYRNEFLFALFCASASLWQTCSIPRSLLRVPMVCQIKTLLVYKTL